MKKTAVLFCAPLVVILALFLLRASPASAARYHDAGPDGGPGYLYYIEGTGSYYLPGEAADVFYNLGRWYRRSGGSWSMSEELDGPWSRITLESLPADLAQLPADFADTRRLGMIPYRYVAGPEKEEEPYYIRYYRVEYYEDYERRGYRRRWHPRGKFWFFVAPGF